MTSTTYSYPVGDSNQREGGSGTSGCLKFGCGMGLGLIALVIIAICAGAMSFRSAIKWVEDGVQSEPLVFAAPELTPAQRLELARIHREHKKAYRDGTDWDLKMSPDLFNAFVIEEIDRKKQDGTFDEGQEPAGVEFIFQGDDTVVRASVPAPDQDGFLNFEVRGDPSIENGRFQGRIESIKLAGEEAPWLVQKLVDGFVEKAREGTLKAKEGGQALSVFKLLRREGDQIHVVIEAGKVPKPGDE